MMTQSGVQLSNSTAPEPYKSLDMVFPYRQTLATIWLNSKMPRRDFYRRALSGITGMCIALDHTFQ
jgi:hypothetical protein